MKIMQPLSITSNENNATPTNLQQNKEKMEEKKKIKTIRVDRNQNVLCIKKKDLRLRFQ